MLYYQNPFLKIETIQQYDLVLVKWCQFENSYQYREGLDQVLAAAKEFKPRNWIFDLQEMAALRIQDQRWTANVYMPDFFQTHPVNMAFILSDDYFSNSAIRQIKQSMNPGSSYRAAYFCDIEAALNWIRSNAEF